MERADRAEDYSGNSGFGPDLPGLGVAGAAGEGTQGREKWSKSGCIYKV